MKCKVCGKEFIPTKENHYLTRDKEVVRTGFAALSSSQEESTLYDTFDCPICGSQYVAQERKRWYYPNVPVEKNLPEEESEELSEEEREESIDEPECDEPVLNMLDDECDEEDEDEGDEW